MALSLLMVPVNGALAADTQTVTIDATPSYVAIGTVTSATGAAFDFGAVVKNVDEDTANGYFTIPNSSGVTIDITIQVTVAWAPTTGANSWTYGAPAADQGQLKASSANGGVGGSTGAGNFDITIQGQAGAAELLMDDVTTITNPTFELRLDAPSDFSHGDAQQCIITLSAAAA